MIRNMFLAVFILSWAVGAFGFDVITSAKVTQIDEWDTGFTKVIIDKPTSCGNSYFWMLRTMDNYDSYMARILTALVAGREVRITERSPAHCDGAHLYNPRIGIM